MAIIKFVNEKKEIQVPEGSNLRREAQRAGVGVYPWHQQGAQLPRSGHLRKLPRSGHQGHGPHEPDGLLEKTRLGMSMAYVGNEDTMRLACQTEVNGDIEVKPRRR